MIPMVRQQRISVPGHITFSDLHLRRDGDGCVYFDWAPVRAVCETSGVDADRLDDASVTRLILAWYQAHRRDGGQLDAVVEDLIAEVGIERRCGSLSHRPGHA